MIKEFLRNTQNNNFTDNSDNQKYQSRQSANIKSKYDMSYDYDQLENDSPKKIKNQSYWPKLKQLQTQIAIKRPNNVVFLFVNGDWAQRQIQGGTYSHDIDDQEDEFERTDRPQITPQNLVIRRNAFIEDKMSEEKGSEKKTQQKSEEMKSIIMIALRNMTVLKMLTPTKIWELVEEAQIIDLKKEKSFLHKGDKIGDLIVVVDGSVHLFKGKTNMKPSKTLLSGATIGQSSILFPSVSIGQYIIKERDAKLGRVRSARIRQFVKQANKTLSNLIKKAIESLEIFDKCNLEQLEKIISIGINSPPIYYDVGQQVIKDMKHHQEHSLFRNNTSSVNQNCFFIVVEGEVGEFHKKMHLSDNQERSHLRVYIEGDTFGDEALYNKVKHESYYIAQCSSTIIQMNINDIERSIGPLSKLLRRKESIYKL